MKKMLAFSALALSVALVSEHKASAWVNCKFGVGLNWSLQSGGNNLLWGLFRNGQPPGPEVAYPGAHPGMHPGAGPYGHPSTFPNTTPFYGPQDFQYFGQYPNGGQQPAPAAPAAQPAGNQISYYGQGSSPYQPVSYVPYQNNYYPASYSSYYGNAPSYWYGR